MHKIIVGKTTFRPLPDGKYKVRLKEIIEDEIGVFKQERFTFRFEIIEGEYQQCICDYLINQNADGIYGVGNKLGKTIAVLRKKECEIGEYFNIFDLIGLKCIAYIELKKGKKLINRIYRLEELNE